MPEIKLPSKEQLDAMNQRIEVLETLLETGIGLPDGASTAANQAGVLTELATLKADLAAVKAALQGTLNTKLTGSSLQNGDSIPVGIKGAPAEIASAKHTEMFGAVAEYAKAEGASQIEIYVETGYVRIRTDGQPCTEDTGEPLGAGFGMAWCVPSISVYFADDATVTVVSR